MVIIDGKNSVLGRIASYTAKKLINGEEIKLINVNKILITGDPVNILGKYLKKKSIGSPQHGPFISKKPDMLVRRAIRGMIPYKTKKGKNAIKKLKVYEDLPEEFSKEKIEKLSLKPIKSKFITIEKLSKLLGG